MVAPLNLALQATMPCLAQLLDSLQSHGAAAQWRDADLYQITLVLEELMMNVINHGSPAGEVVDITVRITTQGDGADIVFVDGGVPYNPLLQPEPDLTSTLEDRPIGGLGVHFLKIMMDSVEYTYVDHQNRLTLRKNFQ
jgi:anti-sigma regulatory factor (Ser/Thr protein kinase)